MNLKKNQDRYDIISSALEKQGLKFQRFDAVLGLDLKIEDQKGRIFYGKDLKSKKASFRIGEKYKIYCPNITLNYEYKPSLARSAEPLSAGEFGIYCSHYEIMLDVIKNKNKAVLVFEDDALIPNNLSQVLNKLSKQMPNYKKYGVIYLGWAISDSGIWGNIQKIKRFPSYLLEKITDYPINLGATHAIVYGYSGAAKMIDNLQINQGTDLDLFESVNRGEISSYKIRGFNLFQNGIFESEIKKDGRL